MRFYKESKVVFNQVTNFLDNHYENTFPDNELKIGIYNAIRDNFLGLSLISVTLYNEWLQKWFC